MSAIRGVVKKIKHKKKAAKVRKSKATSGLLSCSVKPGMFESEYAVSIDLPEGNTVSLFADKRLIKKKNNNSFLEVDLWPEKGGASRATVLLPTESFETGSRWVSVRQDQIRR